MSKEESDYISYLLRMWRDDGHERTTWRASLDSSLTGERQSFASLNELFTFLRRQTRRACNANGDASAKRDQRGA